MSQDKIYLAGPLFNGPRTFFNIHLCGSLEKKGHSVILPQRDGFEFNTLNIALGNRLPAKEIPPAVKDIIYCLDIGKFIPESDAVVANFDEPISEGVIAEVYSAIPMSKKTICYRTDVRSPYGNVNDPLKGLHFFSVYQTDAFLYHHLPAKSPGEALTELNRLADKIENVLNSVIKKKETPPLPPHLQKVIQGAEILFKGIIDIHSEEGLSQIVERYVANQSKFRIAPQVF